MAPPNDPTTRIEPTTRVDAVKRVRRAARSAVADLSKMAVHASIDVGGRRGVGVGAFLLALVTAGAMAHVGVRMKGIEVAYNLGRERHVNTQLEEERRRLNIEIGMLKDPVRVVSIARDKLQMGPPAQADVVRLVPGTVLGARPETPPQGGKADKTPAKPRPRVAASAGKAPTHGAPTAAKDPAPEPDDDRPAVEDAPSREGDE